MDGIDIDDESLVIKDCEESTKGQCDEDVELRHDTAAVQKLEVLRSSQFNRLLFIDIGLMIFTFLHVSILTILCRTAWKGSKTRKGVEGKMITYPTCSPDNTFLIILYSQAVSAYCA